MTFYEVPVGFQKLLHSLVSPQTIEQKIQLSVTEQATGLWQTFWERCFENKHQQAIPLEIPFEPYLKACQLWTDWVHERQKEWGEKAAVYVRFGRHEDAQKERVKSDQLRLVAEVWMKEVQQKWTV